MIVDPPPPAPSVTELPSTSCNSPRARSRTSLLKSSASPSPTGSPEPDERQEILIALEEAEEPLLAELRGVLLAEQAFWATSAVA